MIQKFKNKTEPLKTTKITHFVVGGVCPHGNSSKCNLQKGTGSELGAICIMLKWKKKAFSEVRLPHSPAILQEKVISAVPHTLLCGSSAFVMLPDGGSRAEMGTVQIRLLCSPVGGLQSFLPPLFLFYLPNITFSLSQAVFLRRSMPNVVQGPWGVTGNRERSFLFWCVWRRCLKYAFV